MTGALRTLRGLLEIHVVAVLVPGTSLLAIFFTTSRRPSSELLAIRRSETVRNSPELASEVLDSLLELKELSTLQKQR